jgi:hypothetical protein
VRQELTTIAQHLVRPGYDWSAKYKVPIDLDEVNEQDRSEQSPRPRRNDKAINDVMMDMDRAEFEDKCEFIDFSSVPFDVKKRSRSCQICNYEMQKPKWKGVVMCMNHGVRLCTGIMPPESDTLPELYQLNGEKVIDYSWTCPTKTSCWNKFHDFAKRIVFQKGH